MLTWTRSPGQVRTPTSAKQTVLPRRNVVLSAVRRSRRNPTEAEGDEVAETASSSPGLSAEQKARKKAIKEVLFKINQKYGQGSIMQMSGAPLRIERTSSGCLTLDKALGGGYPKGRIIEIFGPESSGKTTLALHAIAEVQKQGLECAFIDAENAFDPNYAERIGIDTEELLLSQPDHGEHALNIMDELARSNLVGLIVVDSVSALVPRSEMEGDIGTPQIGSQARLMSMALRKIAGNAAKSKCTIIFINQLRHKVGVIYGNPETTSGGNALKYYSTMRLDIRSKEKITELGREEPIGNKVKVKVVKNKVSPPFEVAEFDILYGEGINALGCVIDVGKSTGVLDVRGSHYYFEGNKLAQGRDNVLQHLKENPDTAARISTAVKQRLAGGGVKSGGSSSREDDDVFDEDDDDDGFDEALLDDDAFADDLNARRSSLSDD